MNNTKNYNSSYRKELLTVSLAVGFVPFKCLPLINPNKASIQHIVNIYIAEGDFEKYHKKDIWALAPTQQLRDRIYRSDQSEKENLGKKFSEPLKDYYKEYSMNEFYKLKSSDKKYDSRKIRALRNGEVFTFFYGAGFDTLPGSKKNLNELTGSEQEIADTTFFPFRELTNINKNIYFNDSEYEIKEDATEAINLTKINGIISLKGAESTYTVINAGKKLDQYKRNGERKSIIYINNILASTTLPQISGCIILYSSEIPIKKLIYCESKERQFANNLFEAYEETNMFVVPLTPEGQELTKIMNNKYWQEKLNAITIKKDWRTNNNAYVTFDGTHYDETKKITYYHFNFLIPNIARLKKFLYFAESNANNEAIYCIYCYDFQKSLLEDICPPTVELRPIPFKFVKSHLEN